MKNDVYFISTLQKIIQIPLCEEITMFEPSLFTEEIYWKRTLLEFLTSLIYQADCDTLRHRLHLSRKCKIIFFINYLED